jgi:DNA repair photolyase
MNQSKNKKLPDYNSPRITSEFGDCSMPITFDQYSNCGFNCAYCFSQYIRGVGPSAKNYDQHKIKAVRVDRIRKIFTGEKKTGYWPWIKAKRPIQWGGLSDPFCPLEEKYGVGLELLKFFNEIEYPISFSSKSDLILRDSRYLDEFKKAGDRWHYKASIITLDPEKSRLLEKGAATPQRRIEVLKTLHEQAGTLTTWRMRPFIIGVTDQTMPEMIKTAKKIGCQSITTEFFCLDTRAFGRNRTLNNYKDIARAAGFSLIKFYKKYGTGCGYVRLKYDFLKPYVRKYKQLCDAEGLPFFISDAMHKEKSCSGSCCGLLDSNKHFENYARRQMTNLILVAKKIGYITLDMADQVADNVEMEWRTGVKVEEFMNVGGKRSRVKNMTYEDYFIRMWNEGFFEKYFNGTLQIKGKDDRGNAIYFYNYKKANL